MRLRPSDTVLLRRLLSAWPEDPVRFEAVRAEVRDWDSLLDHAARHGLFNLLADPLRACTAGVPPEVGVAVEERLIAQRLWQKRLLEALQEMLSVLVSAGIPVAVLKGPVLSERLFGSPFQRTSNDLDLLIAPAGFSPAVRALEGLGYQLEAGPSARYYERYHHHLTLHRAGWPDVELHRRLFTGFGVILAAEPFLSRSVDLASAYAGHCRVLSPEDEFLHLAVHAAGHAFARLGWLYDLKAFLHVYPRLDWGHPAKPGAGTGSGHPAGVQSGRAAAAAGGELPCRRRVGKKKSDPAGKAGIACGECLTDWMRMHRAPGC